MYFQTNFCFFFYVVFEVVEKKEQEKRETQIVNQETHPTRHSGSCSVFVFFFFFCHTVVVVFVCHEKTLCGENLCHSMPASIYFSCFLLLFLLYKFFFLFFFCIRTDSGAEILLFAFFQAFCEIILHSVRVCLCVFVCAWWRCVWVPRSAFN